MMGDRNAEIWSTRLQREILALESTDDASKKVELLPPFIKATNHTLNLDAGLAKIEFRIDVELPVEKEEAKDEEDAGKGADQEQEKESKGKMDSVKDDKAGDGGAKEDDATVDNKEKGASHEGETAEDNDPKEVEATRETAAGATDGEDTTENAKNSESTEDAPQSEDDVAKQAAEGKFDPHVVLILDASLYWKPDSSSVPSSNPQCYPFQKPLAIIKSGANLFSSSSTIHDGDEVDIDLDWTPSIHLSDAVTNVALKIRECVKRGEPLHPSEKSDVDDGEGLSGTLLREAREAKESLLETKKAVGAIFSSGISSLSARGSSFAAKGVSAKTSVRESFMNLGESLSQLTTEAAGVTSAVGEGLADEDVAVESSENEAKKIVKVVPDIGDVIDLSESPWNQCIGMYSCKALKRPTFMEDSIAEAAMKQKKEKEVSSAGSMFSRFAQSAKSVMEESFLMVTDKSLIEFRSNKLNVGSGTVTFAIKIERMAKLKFRREESLSLFFKEASDDPLVYMCLDSAHAVQDIQNVLKAYGVKGKHTNAATQRAVQMALNLVALIQQKERELIDQPTVDRVNEIMDLYRQSAEKFETAGDPRHAEVMAHMKRFLNQQFTISILDGSYKGTPATKTADSSGEDEKPSTPVSVPQGEVLEPPTYNHTFSNDDEDDDHIAAPVAEKKVSPIKDANEGGDGEGDSAEAGDILNDSTMENMNELMSDAMKDLSDLGMDDEEIDSILTSPSKKTSSETDDLTEHDETFAELDAMLSDADKELNELLSS